jgi:hypothetical protein
MIAPETFELDDVDGHAHPVAENVSATQRQFWTRPHLARSRRSQ